MKSQKQVTPGTSIFVALTGTASGRTAAQTTYGYPGPAKVANTEYYDRHIASSRKIAKAADFGATALLSNHTEFDNAFYKAHAVEDRKGGEVNPFDVGADGVARYVAVVDARTTAARIHATGK